MKFLSVDRIENGWVICEDELGEKHEINISKLPSEIKEGDILTLNLDGNWTINHKITNSRKQYIIKLRNEIYKQN